MGGYRSPLASAGWSTFARRKVYWANVLTRLAAPMRGGRMFEEICSRTSQRNRRDGHAHEGRRRRSRRLRDGSPGDGVGGIAETEKSSPLGVIHMDAAYLSALSALAGSMVGGLTLGVTSWLSERTRARAGKLAHDLSRREDLFKDFIVAASKAYGEALMSNEPQIQELIALYAMISGMRVGCSPRTIACAEKIMRATTDACVAPNKTIPQLHEMLKSGAGIDPLKDFAEAARDELSSL